MTIDQKNLCLDVYIMINDGHCFERQFMYYILHFFDLRTAFDMKWNMLKKNNNTISLNPNHIWVKCS